jgi:hypothetical protein
MKCWLGRFLATLLLLFWVGGTARADLMVPWTYTWSRNPLSVAADNDGTGGVSLTLSPLAAGTNLTGDNEIKAVSLSTFSSAPTGTVDTFSSSPYSLTVHLTDLNSGATGALTFSGQFNGTLSATTASISNTFLSPSSQSIVLGQDDYTVTLNSYLAPNQPNSTTFGYIQADVTITPATGSTNTGNGNTGNSGGVQAVPEPSTLLLAGLALPAGLAWWRVRSGRGRDKAND